MVRDVNTIRTQLILSLLDLGPDLIRTTPGMLDMDSSSRQFTNDRDDLNWWLTHYGLKRDRSALEDFSPDLCKQVMIAATCAIVDPNGRAHRRDGVIGLHFFDEAIMSVADEFIRKVLTNPEWRHRLTKRIQGLVSTEIMILVQTYREPAPELVRVS